MIASVMVSPIRISDRQSIPGTAGNPPSPSSDHRTRRLRGGFATLTASGVVVIVALFVRSRSESLKATPRAVDAAGVVHDVASAPRIDPIRIPPVRTGLIQVPADELEVCLNRIHPTEQPKSVSFYLHILRLHGLDARFEHSELQSSDDILHMLTDDVASRSLLGASTVVRTRNGVAFLGDGEDEESRWRSEETHRDQCLAALAELGVPLTCAIRIDGAEYSVEDVLRDSLANFHFGQQELQWTALAYILYLPPQREWVNKFGERITFDELVEHLLQLSLDQSSCAGTHLVHTLTLAYRVDREHHAILSHETRTRLRARVERFAAAAVTTQEQNGSWPLNWHQALRSSDGSDDWLPGRTDPGGRLLVTGHLAEWLLYLPGEFGVPDDCLERAGDWLLTTVSQIPEESAMEQVCPYTHAACVLRALSRDGAAASESKSSEVSHPTLNLANRRQAR